MHFIRSYKARFPPYPRNVSAKFANAVNTNAPTTQITCQVTLRLHFSMIFL